MQILIAKEKHGDRYFDASSNEKLHKACVKLLQERLNEGYYQVYEDKDLIITPDDVIEKLAGDIKEACIRNNSLTKRRLREIEEDKAFLEDVNTVLNSQEIIMTRRRVPVPWSLELLLARSRYEYENVELIELEEV